MTTGSLMVPNVGIGDIKITFNNQDPAETARAIRMLLDMQRRGYAILVQLADGTYTRAIEIDAEHASYVVRTDDVPEPEAAPAEAGVPSEEGVRLNKDGTPDKRFLRKGPRASRRRVPIETSHAVGVARSAGG